MKRKKINTKGLVASDLELLLEAHTVRSLLEAMADHALNSNSPDFESYVNFGQAKQTLETLALLAKPIIDADAKIEVAEAAAKEEEDTELNKKGIVMPNGVEITMNSLKKNHKE